MGGHSKSRKTGKKVNSGGSADTTRNGDCSTSGTHHLRSRSGIVIQGTLETNSVHGAAQNGGRREIHVSELEINEHHDNRVLIGTFCVEPFVIDCVYTVLEDEDGSTVRVLIDDENATTATRKSKFLARYSKGKLVRILDPYFKTCDDGGTVIKVENCLDIVDDESEMPEQKVVIPPPTAGVGNGAASAVEIEGSGVCREVERLRCEGNAFFSSHDWKGALLVYSECISKCLTMMTEFKPPGAAFASSSDFSEGETLARILLLAYSNRSETWLRLHDYDKAQSDACMALEVDPKHVKSLNRKGKALLELQLFEEAGACFNSALQESPGDSTINANYTLSKTSLEQSRDGVFDLNDYLLSCLTKQPPQCSEFVGSVEVRRTPGGLRGIFATRDVASGELLMVSNAVAFCVNSKHRESDNEDEDEDEYVYEDEDDEDEDDEFKRCGTCEACEMEKWDRWHIRRRRLRCLDELKDQVLAFAKSSKRRFYQVASLAGLCRSKDPPVWSMELYRPGSTWMPQEAPDDFNLETETLRDIIRNNSMDEVLNDPKFYMTGQQRLASAMWVLPSIMNHSCCPNSETWCVGKTMFVRANRAVSAGEELTRAYFDVLKGLEHRQGMALGWPFKCNCPRCKWEANLPADQAKLRKKLDLRVSQLFRDSTEHPSKTMAVITHCVACVEDSPIFQGLDGKYRHWMRASVMDAYIAYVQALRVVTTNRIHTVRMALTSMVQVGGGYAMRPQMASTLLRDVKKKCGKSSSLFRSTESLVMDVYKPYYGELNKKTFWALVRMSNMDCLAD